MNIGTIQRHGMITLFWQLVLTAIGFLSTMYFAHAMGASVLGAFYLFMAYWSILDLALDGGLGGAAIKRISEGEEEEAYFSAFFVLRSIFIFIILFALIAFKKFFVDLSSSGLFGWLLLMLIINGIFGTVSVGISGRRKMGVRSSCNAITNISIILFQITGVFLGYGVEGLAGGTMAGLFVGGIIEYHFFDLHFARFTWQHIKSLFIFSFWIFLTSAGVLVFLQADIVLVGYFLENSDVGVYKVVSGLTMAATFITYSLRAILWPSVSHWGKKGEIYKVNESLSRAISYSLLLAIPVFIGGVLLGDKLLYFFYGTEFTRGYSVLVIMLAVQIVNIFQYFFTMYLDALNHPKESFKVTAFAASANILLDIILIPIFGIEGAAIATFASMILNALLAHRALSGLMVIHVEKQSLCNILKASLVMCLIVIVYRMFVPISSIWLVLFPVLLGGGIFGVLIIKLDKKMHGNLKEIVTQAGLRWPEWI